MIIYDNVIIESHNAFGKLRIGDFCVLSYGVIISCSEQIHIGNDVWIGEYSSIRDSTHDFNMHTTIRSRDDIKAPVFIGNNVWIGRNCIIMPGTIIEDNVIIGANSLVRGHCKSNSLYAGSPAIFKKHLN